MVSSWQNFLTTNLPRYGLVTHSGLSSFNYIVKTNYPSFLTGSYSETTTIIPFLGFPVTTSSSELTQEGITVTVNPLANAYDLNLTKEIKLKLVILLSFSNPANLALESALFVPVEIPASTLVANTEVTLTSTFNDYFKSLCQ